MTRNTKTIQIEKALRKMTPAQFAEVMEFAGLSSYDQEILKTLCQGERLGLISASVELNVSKAKLSGDKSRIMDTLADTSFDKIMSYF